MTRLLDISSRNSVAERATVLTTALRCRVVDPLKGIKRAFTTHIGPDAVARLMATDAPLPDILIAGDQLTGKTTQARTLP